MKNPNLFPWPRILGLLLSLSLALPQTAAALRPMSGEGAGAEELNTALQAEDRTISNQAAVYDVDGRIRRYLRTFREEPGPVQLQLNSLIQGTEISKATLSDARSPRWEPILRTENQWRAENGLHPISIARYQFAASLRDLAAQLNKQRTGPEMEVGRVAGGLELSIPLRGSETSHLIFDTRRWSIKADFPEGKQILQTRRGVLFTDEQKEVFLSLVQRIGQAGGIASADIPSAQKSGQGSRTGTASLTLGDGTKASILVTPQTWDMQWELTAAGAEEKFIQKLRKAVAGLNKKMGRAVVELETEGMLQLRFLFPQGNSLEIYPRIGQVNFKSGGENQRVIRRGPVKELSVQEQSLWVGYLNKIRKAGGVVGVQSELFPGVPAGEFMPGWFSLRMANGDSWLVVSIDQGGNWTTQWQQSYASLAKKTNKLEQVPLDSVLQVSLRGGPAPWFFPVKVPVRIPASMLREGALRIIPKSGFDAVAQLSLAGNTARAVFLTQRKSQAEQLREASEGEDEPHTTEKMGFQMEAIPPQEGGGALLTPLKNQTIRVEHVPPELELDVETLGYAAWVLHGVHQEMKQHPYSTEGELLADPGASTLARLPVYLNGKDGPVQYIRVHRFRITGHGYARKSSMQVEFPAGTWSPSRLKNIGGVRADRGPGSLHIHFRVQVPGGFESVLAQIHETKGTLRIIGPEQPVGELLNTLRVFARLAAVLMEKAEGIPTYKEVSSWPLETLIGMAKTETGTTEPQFLTKYLALTALTQRPDPRALREVLDRLRVIENVKERRYYTINDQGVRVTTTTKDEFVRLAEPDGVFRLLAILRFSQRQQGAPLELSGSKIEDPELLLTVLERIEKMIIGDERKKEPMSTIRWVAAQAAPLFTPQESDVPEGINWVINMLRFLRDDWDEVPAIRWKAGQQVEQLKAQREHQEIAPAMLQVGLPNQVSWVEDDSYQVMLKEEQELDFFRRSTQQLRAKGVMDYENRVLGHYGSGAEHEFDRILPLSPREQDQEEQSLEIFRGPIRFRSRQEDMTPRATLILSMRLDAEGEKRLEAIFPEAMDLKDEEAQFTEAEQEEAEGIGLQISMLGHTPLNVTLFYDDGAWKLRTDKEKEYDLADDVLLMLALAAQILPSPPERPDESGWSHAGLEEKFIRAGLVEPGQRRAVMRVPAHIVEPVRLFHHPSLRPGYAGVEQIPLPEEPERAALFLSEVAVQDTDLILLPPSVSAGTERQYRPSESRAGIIVVPDEMLSQLTLGQLSVMGKLAQWLGGVYRAGMEEWDQAVIDGVDYMSLQY